MSVHPLMPKVRWEYGLRSMRSAGIDGRAVADMLREMGDQGWELVSVTSHLTGSETLYVFKRELPING